MNPSELLSIQNDLHAVFSALYLIDADQLSSDQRKQHKQPLSAAYLAWVSAENAQFDLLNNQMKTELNGLVGQVRAVRKDVSGLVTPLEKLSVLLDGVDVLARLSKGLT